jgi:crotonobetainyl-CoA:carnitine CoA-transferase CaiB-like acyl-CoA transferase
MLSPYRVLDLTDEKGFLCGKILADLGADVIKVEKPGGDHARNIEPFYHNIPHPEKSLYWFAFNLNKRSITLNLETADGKDIFKRLVQTADFVVESFPVGHMKRLGLDYSVLRTVNPSIVMTSITPFGQKGPYKNYKASDITLVAMGGLLYITGYPDRCPVRISFPQSWLLAGSSAASATMTAHYYRQVTGIGQHVDVPIQASIVWAITNTIPLWELNRVNLTRQGSVLSGRFGKSATQRIIWPCKDGFVAYVIFGGRLGISMGNHQLTEWIDQEGLADDFIRNFDWESYDLAVAKKETQGQLEAYAERLFLRHTKLEIYQEGLKRNIKIFPVYSPKDILKDPQFRSRDFWIQLEHPELNETITYPGAFFKSSEVSTKTQRKPPLIGEHNQEVYQELGISMAELAQLKQAKVI